MNRERFHERHGIYPLRQWTYPKTRPYNGFTPDERIRGWQLTMWFVDNGWIAKPVRCSITGETDDVVFHNENYYTPWAPHEIARSMHRALHQRFTKPGWWHRIMRENTRTGEEWFCRVSLDPTFDLARAQRAEFGDDVREVFARAPVPDHVEVPWEKIRPQVHPLEDSQ